MKKRKKQRALGGRPPDVRQGFVEQACEEIWFGTVPRPNSPPYMTAPLRNTGQEVLC